MKGGPLVSIRCLVYNHEPYLRHCLDGFVMQKTTFPFEAIVHDDASTDGSAAIIREYAEKYPDIIKPIYETENQWGKGTISKTMDAAMHPNSKYIALCEGDDYWTDPNKLQLQVGFLESHPDYVICSGNYRCFYQNEERLDDSGVYDWLFLNENVKYPFFKYSLNNYFDDWWIRTLTCIYRRSDYLNRLKQKGYTCIRDDLLYYEILLNGNGALLKNVMGVYRVHPGGFWSGNDVIDNLKKQIFNAFQIYKIEGDKRALIKIRRCMVKLLNQLNKRGDKRLFWAELYSYYTKVSFLEFFRILLCFIRSRLSVAYHRLFN